MTPEETAADLLKGCSPSLMNSLVHPIGRAIRAAVAEEREACAKVADQVWEEDCGQVRGLENAAERIRARGDRA